MYSMLIKVTVVLLAHGDAHASVEDALEVPSFDALEHARHKIVTRAKEINHAATVSDFERQGRMPDRDSIPNADCVFVPKRFIGGNRAMIYRRVNKSGSQTVLALIRALAKELAPRGTEPKFQSYSCSAPELEIARSQGAVDFAIVRDPLDRWVSGYYFLGRSSAVQWESLAHYTRDMAMWEWDAHGLPQAYFYTHPSRRDYAHSAVIKLENIAEEWPALISLVLAGPDGRVVDTTLYARALKVSRRVPHHHRNDGDQPSPAAAVDGGPDGPAKPAKPATPSVKKNPLGGGPGSGLRFMESRSEEERRAADRHVCAFLAHDYALLSGEYAAPAFCAGTEAEL